MIFSDIIFHFSKSYLYKIFTKKWLTPLPPGNFYIKKGCGTLICVYATFFAVFIIYICFLVRFIFYMGLI